MSFVSAENTRRHILALSKKGVGRRAISDAAGVASATVASIRNKSNVTILCSTQDKILAVDADAIADNALVPAQKTWELLNELIEDGYDKKQIAEWLSIRQIQFSRSKVLARTELKVKKLYYQIRNGSMRRAVK